MGVSEGSEMIASWMRWPYIRRQGSFEETEEETQAQRRSRVRMEVETGGTRPPARGRLGPQTLEEAGGTFPWIITVIIKNHTHRHTLNGKVGRCK